MQSSWFQFFMFLQHGVISDKLNGEKKTAGMPGWGNVWLNLCNTLKGTKLAFLWRVALLRSARTGSRIINNKNVSNSFGLWFQRQHSVMTNKSFLSWSRRWHPATDVITGPANGAFRGTAKSEFNFNKRWGGKESHIWHERI